MAALAERLELDLERPVRALSKGNKQKVGLVAAFAARAELLILDEPSSGLDPLLQVEFQKMVSEAAAEGATVLLSSHVLSEVEHVADRVGIIRGGRLVDVLDVEELKAHASRHVEVTFADPGGVPPGPGQVPNVEVLAIADGVGRYAVSGEMDAFVKALAAHRVVTVRSEDADLEQVFLRYYQGAGPGLPAADRPPAGLRGQRSPQGGEPG